MYRFQHARHQLYQLASQRAMPTDYKVSAVTITPSLAVFGGKSRSSQTLSETNFIFSGAAAVRYDADTRLDWTDWGGRVGLSGSVPVADWLTFVAGGNAGLATRRVSLTGSDSANIFTAGGIPIFATAPSATTSGETTTALVANAEASVNIRLAPNWALRAFGGLNYDDKVPGSFGPGCHPPVRLWRQEHASGYQIPGRDELLCGRRTDGEVLRAGAGWFNWRLLKSAASPSGSHARSCRR